MKASKVLPLLHFPLILLTVRVICTSSAKYGRTQHHKFTPALSTLTEMDYSDTVYINTFYLLDNCTINMSDVAT